MFMNSSPLRHSSRSLPLKLSTYPFSHGLPAEDSDRQKWLMSGFIEREPKAAPLEDVRSFALRLGNPLYPHMKLKLARVPAEQEFVFLVDTHDEFLEAPAGTAEHESVQELKRRNTALAAVILERLEAAGLPTEHSYLRRKIEQAKQHQ